MNGNSDKHKPLSPEELFRLLETKNEGALSGDGLDDFEREALEGFSAHTSAEKARELTGEVHQRIHEQLDERQKKRPAARIVWFGAAASVVVGLIMSAYLMTREAKFTNELALNKKEAADELKQAPVPEEAPATISEEVQKQEKEAKPQAPAQEITASREQSMPEKEELVFEATSVSKDGDFTRSKHDVADDLSLDKEKSKGEVRKGQAQPGSGYDLKLAETSAQAGYVSNGTVAANKALAVPKEELATMAPAAEKLQKESAVTTDESPRNVNVAKTTHSFKKEKKEEEDANTYAVTTATGSTKTENYKGPLENARAAYYKGGDQELKTQVIAWFKDHQYEVPKGNYHIRVKVAADGTAQVLDVKAEKNADAKALGYLEESLKTMKNWNPAISDQQATPSETAFTLSF